MYRDFENPVRRVLHSFYCIALKRRYWILIILYILVGISSSNRGNPLFDLIGMNVTVFKYKYWNACYPHKIKTALCSYD